MRILHTSDWHLGKHLNNFSRHSEQQDVLEEICEIADREEVNVVIIAGDLFDTFNPPTESTELFYKTLKRLAKMQYNCSSTGEVLRKSSSTPLLHCIFCSQDEQIVSYRFDIL